VCEAAFVSGLAIDAAQCPRLGLKTTVIDRCITIRADTKCVIREAHERPLDFAQLLDVPIYGGDLDIGRQVRYSAITYIGNGPRSIFSARRTPSRSRSTRCGASVCSLFSMTISPFPMVVCLHTIYRILECLP